MLPAFPYKVCLSGTTVVTMVRALNTSDFLSLLLNWVSFWIEKNVLEITDGLKLYANVHHPIY